MMKHKDNARMILHTSYVDTARRHWADAQRSKEMLDAISIEKDKLKNEEEALLFEFKQLQPIILALDEHCAIAIVFSALAIESYIYDYAARRLTDSFVETHLDKLDVMSKWVITPMLTTGKPFPKDKHAFQLLKRLVANRNFLAHGKSTPFFIFDEKANDFVICDATKRLNNFANSLLEKARDAIIALDELALVMEALDPDEFASFALRANVGKYKRHIDKYGV